jgi:nitrite reductase (NADH) large subunit
LPHAGKIAQDRAGSLRHQCVGSSRIELQPNLALAGAGWRNERQDIILNDLQWYRRNAITLHTGKRIVRIDRVRRRVCADDGSEADYDRLLLAIGSIPFILPVPGKELPGVITYRDIADTEAMIEATKRHRHAVVIGAGLLGLEAANGLALRGMNVTVVHLMPWIMERQLDPVAAGLLQRSLEAKGLKFLLERQTER